MSSVVKSLTVMSSQLLSLWHGVAWHIPTSISIVTIPGPCACSTVGCLYSSSGGISSSIYLIKDTLNSVVSLPRSTSLMKCTSTCTCICRHIQNTLVIDMEELMTRCCIDGEQFALGVKEVSRSEGRVVANVPFRAPPLAPRTKCWNTKARSRRGHRLEVLQSRPKGSHLGSERIACYRSSNSSRWVSHLGTP